MAPVVWLTVSPEESWLGLGRPTALDAPARSRSESVKSYKTVSDGRKWSYSPLRVTRDWVVPWVRLRSTEVAVSS